MTARPWTMGFPDAIGTGGREDDDIGRNAGMNEGTSTVGDGASSAPGPVARRQSECRAGAGCGGAVHGCLGCDDRQHRTPDDPSGRPRKTESANVEAMALSFARCPGAPYCGYVARLAAPDRKVRGAVTRSSN